LKGRSCILTEETDAQKRNAEEQKGHGKKKGKGISEVESAKGRPEWNEAHEEGPPKERKIGK